MNEDEEKLLLLKQKNLKLKFIHYGVMNFIVYQLLIMYVEKSTQIYNTGQKNLYFSLRFYMLKIEKFVYTQLRQKL